MADNPENNKKEWPLWWFNGGKYNAVISDCFACEHTLSKNNDNRIDCSKCFLLNLWFNDRIPKNIQEYCYIYTPCENAQNSPYRLYRKWHLGYMKNYLDKQAKRKCSFYARKIFDYCKKH